MGSREEVMASFLTKPKEMNNRKISKTTTARSAGISHRGPRSPVNKTKISINADTY